MNPSMLIRTALKALPWPRTLSEREETSRPAFERSGAELGRVFNAGRVRFRKIDPKKLGKRDEGWYGAGFYVAQSADYVRRWYGPVVNEIAVKPDARVLWADFNPAMAPAGLFDAVMANERALLQARGIGAEVKGVSDDMRQNQIEWVHAVDRFAEKHGYDIVRFSPEEIVVKRLQSVRVVPPNAR